jgi:hypothetical protein
MYVRKSIEIDFLLHLFSSANYLKIYSLIINKGWIYMSELQLFVTIDGKNWK